MSASVVRSFGWSFLEQSGSKAVTIVVQIVLARLLAPEVFGVLAILLVVVSIADSVAQSGLGLALIQKENVCEASYDTAFWLSVAFAVVLYCIMLICSPAIASFYGMPDMVSFLRVLGVTVIFNAVNSIQRARLQKKLEFKPIFFASLLAVVVSGSTGIVCACFGFGVWALIAQSLIQAICLCAAMGFFERWHPHFVFSITEARDLFSFGWKVGVTGILNVFYIGLSELVVGKVCGARGLGYYSQGRKYPTAAIGVINNAVANVLFPAFSAMAADFEKLRLAIARSLKLGTFITLPMALYFVSIAKPLIILLLTETWLPCVFVFQFTCLSSAFTIMQLVNLRAYMALGDGSLYLRLQVEKVLFGVVVICGTAIATHDINATAFSACVVSILSVFIIDLRPAKRMLSYSCSRQLKDVSRTILVALVSTAVSFVPQLIFVDSILLLLSQSVIFIVCYCALSGLFCRLELRELRAVVNALIRNH